MTLAFRDPTIPDSPLAHWDARWKLAAFLLMVVAAVSLQHPGPAAAAVGIALALALVGRVRFSVVAGRAGLLLLVTLPFVVFVPLTQGADSPGWDIGPLHVSRPGLVAGAVITLRVLAVGLLALVLTRTAPLSRTLSAAHALRMPGVLVQVAQLAYRYTFVLAAEARRLRIAMRTRGFRARTSRHTYRTLGHGVGSLLVRGGDHADRVADAMRCRGFDGTYRTATTFRTTPADVLSFAVLCAGTIALVMIDRS
ncbi:MAG TPA: cobalt ECF transporter T component CbiQ [Gemmataceae bacterium]|nr:cobalt ECF transporter T component CbiQ [Gemmataceae bacterium]